MGLSGLLLQRVFFSCAKRVCEREYHNQRFVNVNERSVEYRFVFQHLSEKCPTTVLDIGTGTTALPALMRTCGFVVTATDNVRDFWPNGMFNRHSHIIDDDITNTQLGGQFDFITCISVLEHIRNYEAAMRSMFSLLRPGGHLVLTFPYNEKHYVENVYELEDSSDRGKAIAYITQVFSRKELNDWLEVGGEILEQEYWQFYTGEYWTAGEGVLPPLKVSKDERHQITCLLIQKI